MVQQIDYVEEADFLSPSLFCPRHAVSHHRRINFQFLYLWTLFYYVSRFFFKSSIHAFYSSFSWLLTCHGTQHGEASYEIASTTRRIQIPTVSIAQVSTRFGVTAVR